MLKKWKRVFNLKSINKNINGVFFGFIQLYATYSPQLECLYLTKENVKQVKQIVIETLKISDKTASRYFKKIIEENLISEIILENQIVYKINSIDTNVDNYQIVNYNVLDYILNNSINEFDLQIYVYLLNKYNYKKNYEFTLKELSLSFGYSETYKGKNYKNFKECLSNLKKLNIIDFEIVYTEKIIESKTVYVPAYKIIYVRCE